MTTLTVPGDRFASDISGAVLAKAQGRGGGRPRWAGRDRQRGGGGRAPRSRRSGPFGSPEGSSRAAVPSLPGTRPAPPLLPQTLWTRSPKQCVRLWAPQGFWGPYRLPGVWGPRGLRLASAAWSHTEMRGPGQGRQVLPAACDASVTSGHPHCAAAGSSPRPGARFLHSFQRLAICTFKTIRRTAAAEETRAARPQGATACAVTGALPAAGLAVSDRRLGVALAASDRRLGVARPALRRGTPARSFLSWRRWCREVRQRARPGASCSHTESTDTARCPRGGQQRRFAGRGRG